jgi:hypothetical protein
MTELEMVGIDEVTLDFCGKRASAIGHAFEETPIYQKHWRAVQAIERELSDAITAEKQRQLSDDLFDANGELSAIIESAIYKGAFAEGLMYGLALAHSNESEGEVLG